MNKTMLSEKICSIGRREIRCFTIAGYGRMYIAWCPIVNAGWVGFQRGYGNPSSRRIKISQA